MDKAFPAWGRQRGGGFAAKKEAYPASLRYENTAISFFAAFFRS